MGWRRFCRFGSAIFGEAREERRTRSFEKKQVIDHTSSVHCNFAHHSSCVRARWQRLQPGNDGT